MKKVVVYSEYVAVYLRNVPGNLLCPEEANNAPAFRGVISFMTIKETLPNGRRKTSVIINFKNPFDKEKAPFLHVNCVEMRLFMANAYIIDTMHPPADKSLARVSLR